MANYSKGSNRTHHTKPQSFADSVVVSGNSTRSQYSSFVQLNSSTNPSSAAPSAGPQQLLKRSTIGTAVPTPFGSMPPLVANPLSAYKARKDRERKKVLDKYDIVGYIAAGTYGRWVLNTMNMITYWLMLFLFRVYKAKSKTYVRKCIAKIWK